MISLLPPEFKKQKQYAIYNVLAVKYTIIVVATAAATIFVLLATQILANKQLNDLRAELGNTQQLIDVRAEILSEGKTIDNQLKIASLLLEGEHNFTALLNDISTALPDSARLTSIKLDGDDKAPLVIKLEVKSRQDVTAVQQSLEASERFTHVDIQSISSSENGVTVDAQLTFAPGAAR